MHEIILPRFGLPAHGALVFYLTAGLIIFSYLATRKLSLVPGRLQSVFELVIDAFMTLCEENMGHKGLQYFAPIMTFALYIFAANAIGFIPGLMPPTANINITAGLAIACFAATHIIGVKEHGIKYYKHFVGPAWWLFILMVPIEMIGHLARPMSLSLRLFGNMMGHEKILDVFFIMMPVAYPLLAFASILGVLVIFIQTFVFSLLSMMYFGGAIEESH